MKDFFGTSNGFEFEFKNTNRLHEYSTRFDFLSRTLLK